jgi:hypothetical protein
MPPREDECEWAAARVDATPLDAAAIGGGVSAGELARAALADVARSCGYSKP